MTAGLRAWLQKTRKPLGIIGIIVTCIGAVVLVYVEVRLYGTGFVGKTLWDWLGLLAALAIPVVVGFGAAWFTAQQGKVSDRENKDNQHEAALQAYINNMSELLLDRNLRGSAKEDEVRNIARVRTLTVLPRLDGVRKRSVLQFLKESGLIDKGMSIIDLHEADLSEADLRDTDLRRTNLSGANLHRANFFGANLSEADLRDTDLRRTNLSGIINRNVYTDGANLSGADLHGANLSGADLRRANLSGAHMTNVYLFDANLESANLTRADLTYAHIWRANLFDANLNEAILYNAGLNEAILIHTHLNGANLERASLFKADLRKADLSETNLSHSFLSEAIGTTADQLKQAKSLQGTTMPDGSKHA